MTTNAHPTDHVSEREQRNNQLALEAGIEGIVLLENNGVLPISPCKVALYGAGAQYTIKGGSGSGEVNVRHTVTVEEGLTKAGFEIVTGDWLQRYDAQWRAGKEQFLRSVRRKLWWPSARVLNDLMSQEYRFPAGDRITEREISACGTDTCIYVVSRQSGEGHDLKDEPGSFRLDAIEEHNIRICAERFARMVLVINTGTPIDISCLDGVSGIDAIVYMSQPGMQAGDALAAILTGASTPSGKLAVSWPKRYADVPYGKEFGTDSLIARYKEGIYVGYRYYDSFDVKPRYAFGYGLSYTRFALDEMKAAIDGAQVTCSVRVTNTGERYAGKEVVQVYVQCPGQDREKQRLVAFGKSEELGCGKSETLQLRFPLSALACYDEASAQTILEAGDYLLRIGNSSRTTDEVAVIRVDERVVIEQHRNLCAAATQVAELRHENRFAVAEDLPVLRVAGSDQLSVISNQYSVVSDQLSADSDEPEVMRDFTVEDCIRMCVGTGMSGEDKGFRTPGAVGHTTTDYINSGIPNAEMCDGPAGVRLERRAVQYPNGKIRAVDVSLSVYEFLPRLLLRLFILGDPDKGQLLYQFVTGFPIEAMIAQTWNIPLAERIGKAVSEEMSEYGVMFWLAPAMNIVRNPLCGRNYEYYSEDPLVTGLFATAVTRGVQATKGNYVTLKHFCANNQETNRFHVSSEVDERALREIYWKGFEMTVKAAQPRAVMAAYNKLNGIYCPESHELCTDLLRGEWGFDGVVMTDWFSTEQNRADAGKSIRAGVDLIMPGGKKSISYLQQAYKSGSLPHSDLRRAAARVVRAILSAQ